MKTKSLTTKNYAARWGRRNGRRNKDEWGRTGDVREGMTNKPRGVGDKTAHWPRVRLTTLLAAKPFLLASGQPGHSCFEHRRKRTSSNHGAVHGEKGQRGRKKERNI